VYGTAGVADPHIPAISVAGARRGSLGSADVVDLFDAEAMYDEDYLHFFADPQRADGHTPQGWDTSGETAAALSWHLLGLEPGMSVLDLACGHGHIANRLAARGCQVTGLDSSAVFLRRARADAETLGVGVDYVHGDMRALPWAEHFDRVVNWSTAFGYFDDETNRHVLAEVARVLRPGGRLAMDLDNLTSFLRGYHPTRVMAHDDGDMLVDRYHLDALTGRFEAERTVVRDGRARQVRFVKRLFGFPELRDWLMAAGFAEVAAYGEDGAPLAADHGRMVVVAQAS
jgi:SAM-dependent methyltransferase